MTNRLNALLRCVWCGLKLRFGSRLSRKNSVMQLRPLAQLGNRSAQKLILKALWDVSTDVQDSALSVLTDITPVVSDELLQALNHANIKVQKKCIELIQESSDPLALRSLCRTLRTPQCRIASDITTVLLKHGTLSVAPLIHELDDPSPIGRETIIMVLAELQDARALEPLIRIFKDDTPSVRAKALIALSKLSEARAIDTLIAALNDTDIRVQKHAADALSGAMEINLLLTRATSEHIRVRELAIDALVAIGRKSGRLPATLLESLQSSDCYTRECVAIILGQINDRRSLDPLQVLLADPVHFVRKASARALKRMKWKSADQLLDVIESIEMGDVNACVAHKDIAIAPLIGAICGCEADRMVAIEALPQIGGPRVIKSLRAVLNRSDIDVQRSVAMTLMRMGAVEAEATLRVIDAITMGRATACVAEGQLAVSLLLHDMDHKFKVVHAEALGLLRDKSAVIPLCRQLTAFPREGYDLEKCAIVRALVHLCDPEAAAPVIEVLRYARGELVGLIIDLLNKLRHPDADDLLFEGFYSWDHPRSIENAARALGAIGGNRAIESLCAALDVPRLQCASAVVLGEMRCISAVDALVNAVADSNDTMRSSAAEALGRIGDIRAADALIGALKAPVADVRQCAAIALGMLRSGLAVAPLIEALTGQCNVTRRHAALALGRIGDLRAIEALASMLQDSQPENRGTAASALGNMNDESAVRLLREALRDSDGSVRRLAADALGCLHWEYAIVVSRVVDGLAHGDIEICVRDAAIGVDVILGGATSSNIRTSSIATEALLRIGAESIPRLIASLSDHRAAVVRLSIKTLVGFGERAVQCLAECARSLNAQVRQCATEALRDIGSRRAVESLLLFLNDSDTDVRSTAVEALGNHGVCHACESLMALISDPESNVRRRVVQALGQLGNRQALKVLETALHDEDVNIQKCAACAFLKLQDAEVIDAMIVALVETTWPLSASIANALSEATGNLRLQTMRRVINESEDSAWMTIGEALAMLCFAVRHSETFSSKIQQMGRAGLSRIVEYVDCATTREMVCKIGNGRWLARKAVEMNADEMTRVLRISSEVEGQFIEMMPLLSNETLRVLSEMHDEYETYMEHPDYGYLYHADDKGALNSARPKEVLRLVKSWDLIRKGALRISSMKD